MEMLRRDIFTITFQNRKSQTHQSYARHRLRCTVLVIHQLHQHVVRRQASEDTSDLKKISHI